jgi:hypothetical protein
MYDNIGRLMYAKQTDRFKSDTRIEIDLAGYPKGLYYMQIASSEAIMVRKVIVE